MIPRYKGIVNKIKKDIDKLKQQYYNIVKVKESQSQKEGVSYEIKS